MNPTALPEKKVLVADKLAPGPLEVLRSAADLFVDVQIGLSPEELAKRIPGYHALIVRSATKVTSEVLTATDDLLAIGRAGIGVDNVDLATATARGVVVMNTPTANCTPHLGAATVEAEEAVSREIVELIVDYLRSGTIRNAVNAPTVRPEVRRTLAAHVELAEKLGSLAAQLWPEASRELDVELIGRTAELPLEPITASLVVGLLSADPELRVNAVNAGIMARERGLRITASRRPEAGDFSNQLTVRCRGSGASHQLSGTIFAEVGMRLVRVDNTHVEAMLDGYILFVRNEDRPGVVGHIGSLLGDREINVARLQVGVDSEKGMAIALWGTDSAVTSMDLGTIRKLPNVISAIQVKL